MPVGCGTVDYYAVALFFVIVVANGYLNLVQVSDLFLLVTNLAMNKSWLWKLIQLGRFLLPFPIGNIRMYQNDNTYFPSIHNHLLFYILQCSSMCGGGMQSRTAICTLRNGKQVVDYACNRDKIISRRCNTQSCTAFDIGRWSQVNYRYTNKFFI